MREGKESTGEGNLPSSTTSRNCCDTFLSASPLNVGVQDMVTKLRLTTLRGRRGAQEGKKQRLVQVSQLFFSASEGLSPGRLKKIISAVSKKHPWRL